MSDENRWLDEICQGVVRTGFRLKKRIFKAKSPFQTIEVVETAGHGKLLIINGMTMASERDEFVCHEMLAHIPLFLHPRPRRVLVIGGGDGGAVREVLRHKTVELCVLVEIDALVVETAKKHIPQTASALSNRRALVRVEDGAKFVRETSERFDVVIVDSTKPFGPAFYKDVRRILTERGIVVSQAGSPFYDLGTIKNLTKILKTVFPVSDAYTFTNLTYPGGLWAFAYASKGVHPVRHFNSARVKSARMPLQWYNEEIHVGAFALPEFLRKAVGR
ncbi:MAG: polyamine aminopropyltransferase [Elusimicrobiota bacterium]